MSQLTGDFLIDLAKICLVNGNVLDVVKPHLNYSYLGTGKGAEVYKEIFKYIFDYHGAHKRPPSIGLLAQNVDSKESHNVIGRIRDANVYDNRDEIVKNFEEYIRRSQFVDLHQQTTELYNSGKVDEAINLSAERSKQIHEFSLIRQLPSRVFAGFDDRQQARKERDFSLIKIPTGIPQFDFHTRGGIDRGTGILGIARSGGGKTTFLRSLGFNAAFRGVNVLHVAAGDSTQEEIEDGYDAMWTGVDVHDIRQGILSNVDTRKIENARKAFLNQSGEIFIKVYNQFHTASIADVRLLLIDLLKEYDIGLVLFDYLEKFSPGDKQRYGTNDEGNRAKKLATAEKIINIATEFKVGVGTVTQANDVPREIWNDPAKFLTRSNISNLKATIDPFAYCITLNQTEDENDKEIMRIHEEKLRHYKIRSFEATYRIAQKRDVGRFIDLAETNKKFWDPINKKIIKAA